MSVKANLTDAKDNAAEIRRDLAANVREAQCLRCDYGILEHQVADSFNNSMMEMMREIGRLSGALKKEVVEDLGDSVEVKRQMTALIKEKILLQERVLNLTSRVNAAEELVGCDRAKVGANADEPLPQDRAADLSQQQHQQQQEFREEEDDDIEQRAME